MSIVVKNSQLNDETIASLNEMIELDINAVAAFRLTRVIKEISSIVEDKMSTEKRILDKWTIKGEDGNPSPALDESGSVIPGAVNIKDPEAFTKEMSDLLDTNNEIQYEKIKFEDLGLKTAKVKDLIKLEFLFD
jgi:hypothetical protein